jgi:uncharacterized protein DUF4402
MFNLSRPLHSLSVAVLLLSAAAADAAPVPARTDASGKATILSSLSVLKKADLDFGVLVAGGAGTAVINPANGALTLTGPLTSIGATAHAATFITTGSRNSVVLIRVPTAAVTLTRVGGTETMTVSNWTLDGSNKRKVPLSDTFDFSVGGTLNVGAAQAEGTYAGTFQVTVQYP